MFNHGLSPEQFLVGGNQNLGKEMLECMKPAELSVPTALNGIRSDAASLNPLAFLANADVIDKVPLLASFGDVTDFANTFFSQIPGLYSLLHQDTAGGKDKIYSDYLRAYFSQDGFVSRSGLKLKFPSMPNRGLGDKPSSTDSSKSTDLPASVDFTQVGTDVVRVILEALRDGSKKKEDGLPGVEGATGVKLAYLQNLSEATQWHVSTERFMEIESQAGQAEGLLATALGKAARGGFWGSLNNEALAKVAETAAGVEARHVVERLEWCKSRTEKPKQ